MRILTFGLSLFVRREYAKIMLRRGYFIWHRVDFKVGSCEECEQMTEIINLAVDSLGEFPIHLHHLAINLCAMFSRLEEYPHIHFALLPQIEKEPMDYHR
jgi:hypothetical protein